MISILLASYNGENYIAEQIESLLAQTEKDFKLFIRDDKSTDETFSIAQGYERKYPGKIFAMQNSENTGGAKRNFIKMMIEHKDEYVMLCDQDDVWLPDKIEKSLEKIREMEEYYGTSMPILVHTDLKVVDEGLNVISHSYEAMANTSFKNNALRNLLTMNIAAGCTALYNRALADIIQAEPSYFVIHDWWLALSAAAFGKIGAVNEPTILYRQHGGNDIGAKRVLSPRYVRYFLANLNEIAEKVNNSYRQAGSFLLEFSDKLTEGQKDLLRDYSSMPNMTRAGRLRTIVKHKAYMYGTARKIARIIILLKERRVAQ